MINRLGMINQLYIFAGHSSSVGCGSAWYADGRRFNPYVWQNSFVEIGHFCGDWS